MKIIKIDPTKNISTIAMKVHEDWLSGLKLISDEQEYLCDVTWGTYREQLGTWIWKDLESHE